MVLDMILRIQTRYSANTLEEIRLAFDLAVDKKLTDTEGKPLEVFRMLDFISFATIMEAFDRFCANDTALMRLCRNQQIDALPEKEITPEEADAFMEGIMQVAINRLKAGEWIEDPNAALYDWLDQKGRISFTKEEKFAYWERAIQELKFTIPDAQSEAGRISPEKRHRLQQDLRDIINDVCTPSTELRKKNHAKLLALTDYLISIIHQNQTVTVSNQ